MKGTFFDRKVGKLERHEIPLECIKCIKPLIDKSSYKTKYKIKTNLRNKWGHVKFRNINAVWKWF